MGRLQEAPLARQVDRCWNELDAKIQAALAEQAGADGPVTSDPIQSMLGELLELVRDQTRLLIGRTRDSKQQDMLAWFTADAGGTSWPARLLVELDTSDSSELARLHTAVRETGADSTLD